MIDAAQAVERQAAQASAHGVANHQGPGEHGRASQHAQGHGQVEPPMMGQGVQEQTKHAREVCGDGGLQTSAVILAYGGLNVPGPLWKTTNSLRGSWN